MRAQHYNTYRENTIMRTYELTEKATNYFEVEAEMVTDFAVAAIGAKVTNKVF